MGTIPRSRTPRAGAPGRLAARLWSAALAACVAVLALGLLGGTGFGASPTTIPVDATVESHITLTDPAALAAAPTVCTNAVAPLDSDDCGDVAFSAGSPDVLDLGELAGADVQAGALTWTVDTTSPTGYQLTIHNPGTAPVLQSGSDSIPNLGATHITAAQVDDTTGFGIAVGDTASPDATPQGAVSYAASPWETGGGEQGELYRGIPTTPIVIASRTAPIAADPVTVTFAAATTIASPVPVGSYTGTVRLTASVI